MAKQQREWIEIIGVGRGVVVTVGPSRPWRAALCYTGAAAVAGAAAGYALPLLWNLLRADAVILLDRLPG